MHRACKVSTLIVYGLLLGACASTARFEPQTPDQQAIARTMETWFAATRAGDVNTIGSLLAPDATFSFFEEGTRIEAKRYDEEVQQRLRSSALFDSPSPKLVNFKQSAPTNASVEASILTDLERGKWTRTTRPHWDLVRLDGAWRIENMVLNTSLYLNTPPPSGP